MLTTRQAYPPPTLPEHLVVIGSGVTGVEFVHMFASLGSQVTLVVSRQHVLPNKDPEVAQALEDDFLRRGVRLLKGARAEAIDRDDDGVAVRCDDGRVARGTHALLAVGSIPNSEGLGLEAAGVESDRGYVHGQPALPVERPPHLRRRRPVGEAPAVVGGHHAGAKDRRARDGRPLPQPPPPRLRQGGPGRLHRPRDRRGGHRRGGGVRLGRKIRVTKVPFSANAKALINDDWRGFVKIVSDPATGVVLGGSIVGRHAAELISVIALAVNCGLRVTDVVDSLLVHPTLAESLADAAE